MFARFRAADHELAAEKFFVVQFLHGAFCLINGLHLHKGESLGTLIVPIAYHFGVLDMANTIEQFEEVALGRVKRQITDVKTWGSDFDRFRLARRPRLL